MGKKTKPQNQNQPKLEKGNVLVVCFCFVFFLFLFFFHATFAFKKEKQRSSGLSRWGGRLRGIPASLVQHYLSFSKAAVTGGSLWGCSRSVRFILQFSSLSDFELDL